MLVQANVAMYVVYQSVIPILLPRQIEIIDPVNKIQVFGLVTGVAALFAVFANPIAGALSDRTASRFGRRSPWILTGAGGAFGALILLGSGRSILTILVAMCLVQAFMNCFQAALTAAMPERVPASRRGLASSLIGLNFPIGSAIGAMIASRFPSSPAYGYAAVGGIVVLAALIFCIGWREPPSKSAHQTTPATRFELAGFLSAFSHRDFRFTFLSRTSFMLSFFLATGYQLYLLQDYIVLPPNTLAINVIVGLTSTMTICMIAATLISGFLSDLLARRKVFVAGAAALMALALLVPLLLPTETGMYVFSAASGIAFGCYLSVDLALITQVLPNPETSGRDLGVLNMANSGPQIAAPLVASFIILHFGGYPSLFGVAALCAAAAAFLIYGVRGVA